MPVNQPSPTLLSNTISGSSSSLSSTLAQSSSSSGSASTLAQSSSSSLSSSSEPASTFNFPEFSSENLFLPLIEQLQKTQTLWQENNKCLQEIYMRIKLTGAQLDGLNIQLNTTNSPTEQELVAVKTKRDKLYEQLVIDKQICMQLAGYSTELSEEMNLISSKLIAIAKTFHEHNLRLEKTLTHYANHTLMTLHQYVEYGAPLVPVIHRAQRYAAEWGLGSLTALGRIPPTPNTFSDSKTPENLLSSSNSQKTKDK